MYYIIASNLSLINTVSCATNPKPKAFEGLNKRFTATGNVAYIPYHRKNVIVAEEIETTV